MDINLHFADMYRARQGGLKKAMESSVLLPIVLILLYFLPSIVSITGRHHNSSAICVLNLFLGWTFIGWVIALVWSLTTPPPAAK